MLFVKLVVVGHLDGLHCAAVIGEFQEGVALRLVVLRQWVVLVDHFSKLEWKYSLLLNNRIVYDDTRVASSTTNVASARESSVLIKETIHLSLSTIIIYVLHVTCTYSFNQSPTLLKIFRMTPFSFSSRSAVTLGMPSTTITLSTPSDSLGR